MQHYDKRRSHVRYPSTLPVTIVFDPTSNRPPLHTTLCDVSEGGSAFESDYGDLLGKTLTLLLIPNMDLPAQPAKAMRFRTRVVWSARTVEGESMKRFRHGLEFIQTFSDRADPILHLIERGLADAARALESAQSSPAANAPRADEAVAQVPEPQGLLAALTHMADAQVEADTTDTSTSAAAETPGEAAVRRLYAGLAELARSLNIVRAPIRDHAYRIARLPAFDSLAWVRGQAFLSQPPHRAGRNEGALQATLRYELASGETLSVTREAPGNMELRERLAECNVDYTAIDQHSSGSLPRATQFSIPCRVPCEVVATLGPGCNTLSIRLRNVGHFGTIAALVPAERIDAAWIDRLGELILARRNSSDFLTMLPTGIAA